MGHFAPIFYLFTKVKQKIEINNKRIDNLRFYNLSLCFYICKLKDSSNQNRRLNIKI